MTIADRLDAIDWSGVGAELDAGGCTVIPALLDAETCAGLRGAYSDEALFRSRVVMARHGFGRGEYQYFRYPLPDVIGALRSGLYPHLVGVANRWEEAVGRPARYPEGHADFLRECEAAGQVRPTPLLLKYGPGDYNCLHQDLYGEQVFPLQVAILLSAPEQDFTGGEFVMTEQRPRMQSRVAVAPLGLGDALVFAVNERPVRGAKGVYRVKMRHGVSRVRTGARFTLGVIFHDAA